MENVLVALEIAVLVDDSESRHDIPVVFGVNDCAHDIEALSLWYDLIVKNVAPLLCTLVLVLTLDGEVAHLNHLPVLLPALQEHVAFGVFPELLLDLVNNALDEGLLDLAVGHAVVLTKDPGDLLPALAPLAVLLLLGHLLAGEYSLYLAVQLHPLLVVLAALSLRILALVFLKQLVEVVLLVVDDDVALDQTLAFVFEDV